MSRQFHEILGTLAPTRTLTKTLALAMGAANIATIKAILEDFKQLYYELFGVNSFNKLDPKGKVN